MANQITLNALKTGECLKMSNGATDVFIDVMKLCRQILPPDTPSYPLLEWIISRHDSRAGEGFSGFDICDMPWDKCGFAVQRESLLFAIDAMADKTKWNKLEYVPNEEIMLRCIREFKNLIEKTKAEHLE